MPQQRLDKLLSSTGLWSRKEARELVRQGRVSVQGRTAAREDEKYEHTAEIRVDGAPVDCSPFVYLMLHKPPGLLSATRDKHTPTVLDLLPEHLRRRGLFPVGRLDKDTTGLLLLTDDGDLGHALLSPKRHVDKVYFAQVDGLLTQADQEALARGLTLPDGLQCLPAGLELLDGGRACRITLREGKYHQVKRMLEARDAPVTALKRLSMGPLALDEALEPGQWRELTQGERTALLALK